MQPRRKLRALVAATFAMPCAAHAVGVDPGGRGQALIYPYYTVQAAGGNAFNTYISVVNHDPGSDKALRVRFRESRNGREVASLNLFLGRNDVWTAAIVPDGQGTRLVTRDVSCTEPLLWSGQFPGVTVDGLAFGSAAFTGANADGAGEGLDRTREGYIEIIEMATVNNVAPHVLALAITHNAAGMPNNCGAVQGANLASATPAGTFSAPTGGLSGTLTLINVANGMDASLPAEALAQVASRAYFRAAADAYPSFSAEEVDPVSHVAHGNQVFRSTWLRGIDAVSAALMRREVAAEWTVEGVTASQTDFVFTFPTRQHYVATTAAAPFSSAGWAADCGAFGPASGFVGEPFVAQFFNRGQRGATLSPQPPVGAVPETVLCAAAAVAPVTNGAGVVPPPSLLGSRSLGVTYRQLGVNAAMDNGFMRFVFAGGGRPAAARMVSEPTSTRIDLATGQATTGRHTFVGMPVTGFAVRTLRNGTLACATGACQGNYASAFPFSYTRDISSP